MMNNIGHIELSILIGVPAVIGIVLLVVYVCRYMYIIKGKNIRAMSIGGILPGCFFYVLLLVAVTVLLILFAKYWEPRYNTWNTIEHFFQNHSLIASIIGTMVGLGLTFFFLRPKIVLRRAYIYHYKEKKDPAHEERLSICIANLGIFPVHNIKVSAFWMREIDRHNPKINDHDFQHEVKTKRINLFRPEINAIDGIFSAHNTYSCHGERPLITEIEKRPQTYGDTILCRVQATHSLSGLSKVYEWEIDAPKEIDGYNMLEPIRNDNFRYYDLAVKKKNGEVELKEHRPKKSNHTRKKNNINN